MPEPVPGILVPVSTSDDVSRPRPGGRSARVRAAVIDAVFDELIEVGYPAFSVPSVATRAGVNKTSLYRRWGGRDELLADALESVVLAPVIPRDTGSLDGDLRDYARAIATFLPGREGRAILSLMSPEARSLPAVHSARAAIFRSRRELSRDIIARAIERDEVPADTRADDVIDHLVAPLYFRLLFSADPPTPTLADVSARATAIAAKAGAFTTR